MGATAYTSALVNRRLGAPVWVARWSCLLLVCCGVYLPAESQSSVSRINLPVSVVDAHGDPPTWELKVDYKELRQYGLLREGDTVVVAVKGGYRAALGFWEETYSREEPGECSLWLFVCLRRDTKVIEEKCEVEYSPHPTKSGDVGINIKFLREDVRGREAVAKRATLSLEPIEYKPQGPQTFEIWGGVTKTPEKCPDPPKGELVEGPTRNPDREELPSPWFTVVVEVHHPELDY